MIKQSQSLPLKPRALPIAILLALGHATWANAVDVACPLPGGDYNGWTVATGGDFDGDGTNDVATAGPCAFANGVRRAGRVLVFSGVDGSRLRTIKGTKPDERLGASLAFMEDVDGDGADDLAIGSFSWDGATASLSAAGKIQVRTIDGRTLLTVEGAFSAANFGEAAAAIPDLNGDGIEELLVGAGDDRVSGEKRGRAYLLSGANGSVLRSSVGEFKFDGWGSTVAATPDVNGDLKPDVIVASNLADDLLGTGENHGIVKVLSGVDFDDVLLRVAGAAEDGLGRGVAVAGAAGFYTGAPGADPQGKSKAGVVRFFAFDGTPGPEIIEPTPQIDAGFGTSVAVVSDINGDAVDDMIASAPGATVGVLIHAGRVRAFSGQNQALLWTLNGTRAEERLGQWLSSAADFDGDDVPDVLVGAPGAAPDGRRGAGTVRVVSGVDGADITRFKGRRGLETRLIVAGYAFGNEPQLRSFNHRGRRRELRQAIYRGLEEGGLSVGVIDDTGDPAPRDLKIVVGTGPLAGRDTVDVFRANHRNVRVSSFRGIGGAYAGGATVAAGNVVGDTQKEIVVGQADAPFGNVRVKVWNRFSEDPLGNLAWTEQAVFFAYREDDEVEGQLVGATGGNVAVGNVVADVDGFDEILIGPNGGTPAVRIFDAAGNLLDEWLAFIPGSVNEGTTLAVGDLDADGVNEIVASPSSGQPWIRAFDATGAPKFVGGQEVNFFAFMTSAPDAIRLAIADVDVDGAGEIVVASGSGIYGVVRAFEPNGDVVDGWNDFRPFGPAGTAGLAIAATDRLLHD